ncbi:hypothetical protein PN36_28640 [Candidatus Thiomargarita nelsonii]|uniref:Uncharacterized protein n=1 Tax=Candidatus Thiomargarita nelsonii TaxID=1003181 RepID=A0A4E0QLY8_9GAMM|nr:hypothetical protein PN36_28640 [Candidatus Thiomargarita nelsonii]
MIADTEIRLKGMETLMSVLGYVQAERFISLVMREPFDYTIWQRKLWLNSDIEEISHKAMLYRHQQGVGLDDHNIHQNH